MFYQDIFNPNVINKQNYQVLQQQNFDIMQRNEFIKMINALDDFCKAAKNIAPQYQQDARNACILKLFSELFGN